MSYFPSFCRPALMTSKPLRPTVLRQLISHSQLRIQPQGSRTSEYAWNRSKNTPENLGAWAAAPRPPALNRGEPCHHRRLAPLLDIGCLTWHAKTFSTPVSPRSTALNSSMALCCTSPMVPFHMGWRASNAAEPCSHGAIPHETGQPGGISHVSM